ncbi:MAG: glycosyltransferase [Candidatus Micrarchaeia archaeon]
MDRYPGFTIIIPTYNEAKNAALLVRRAFAALPGCSIVVADDCSTDGTRESLSGFMGKPGFVFLERAGAKEKGIAASVLDGAAAAKTDYIIVMDGDFQHPPEKLPGLANALIAGNDLAVASRQKVAGRWPLSRKIISKGAHFLGCFSLALSGRRFDFDIMSGYFGIRRSLILGARRDRIVLSGYKVLFDVFKQLPQNARLASVPYEFGARKGGQSKIGFRHIIDYCRSLVS